MSEVIDETKPNKPRYIGKRQCHKKKYWSKATAEKTVNHMQNKRKQNKCNKKINIIAAYCCPYCGFWHTTSQEQRS